MQLRSGKQLVLTADSTNEEKEPLSEQTLFVQTQKQLIKQIANAPPDSIERIKIVYKVMDNCLLTKNINMLTDGTNYENKRKFILVVLEKCEELESQLLELVCTKPQLPSEDKRMIEKLHNLISQVREKYLTIK